MFRPHALLIALAAAPAFAASLPSSSTDETRVQSLVDTVDGGTRSWSNQGGSGLPTYGAGSGGSSSPVTGGTVSTADGSFRYYTIKQDFGSGFVEEFILYEPIPKPTTPTPLLLAFHAFGVSQKDIVLNTTFLQECAKRRWYMLAPLSANGAHFMSDPGQTNTRSAIDWTLAAGNIDRQRIYGVGFSMGGGMGLNFAARNLDPTRTMLAAVVDHTGAVDLNDSYRDDPSSQFVFDFWYGDGSPGSADPVRMAKSSLFEYDDSTQLVNTSTDLVRNLGYLPIYMVRATNDPLVDLAEQHDRLYSLLAAQGRMPGPSFTSEIVPGSVHKWYTLDAKKACDWLSQFTLQLPTSGRTLAIKESTYFYFYVDQVVVGDWTPFTWNVDTVANRLEVSETANLAGLYVDTVAAGLSTTKVLYVDMSTSDGAADTISLRGFDHAPAGVMRDGKVLDNTWWTYVSGSKSVQLKETDGSTVHSWLVAPGT